MRQWQHITADERLHMNIITPDSCAGYYLWRGEIVSFAFQFGGAWEYLAIGCRGRYPLYDEICAGKNIFFKPAEVCVQYYANHPIANKEEAYCVQLWHCPRSGLRTPKADKFRVRVSVWDSIYHIDKEEHNDIH